MDLPDEITIRTTPETDALAGEYTDGRRCRVCQAVRALFPEAEFFSAGPDTVAVDDATYLFVDEDDVKRVMDSYELDDGVMLRVRPDAPPLTIVARRIR